MKEQLAAGLSEEQVAGVLVRCRRRYAPECVAYQFLARIIKRRATVRASRSMLVGDRSDRQRDKR